MVRCLSMLLSVVLLAAPAAAGGGNGVDELQPRKVVPKSTGVIQHPESTGRLIVKFTDGVKSRANADGTVASRNSADMSTANNIAKAFGLKFTRAINHSEQKLAALQARAAANSRRAQPDLAGILYLDGSMGSLNAASVMLQQLPVVEYVEFEPLISALGAPTGACCLPSGICTQQTATACESAPLNGIYQGDGVSCSPNPCPPPPTGACCQTSGLCIVTTPQSCTSAFKGIFQGAGTQCQPGLLCLPGACCILGNCTELTPPVCVAAQGLFQGVGVKCDDADCTTVGCGESGGNCFTVTAGQPFCLDAPCCTSVCAARPFCCDDVIGEWDELCVQLAHFLCPPMLPPAPGANPCLTCLLNESCYEAHPFPGCNDSSCCTEVVNVDNFCYFVAWDAGCVDLATELCRVEDSAPTPDFKPYQGYLTPDIWQPAIAADLCIFPPCPGPPFRGYCGEGYDLTGNGGEFDGLYGLGQLLFEQGVGKANGARGLGVKVGVIEFGAYVNHEDLDVIAEPGQTIITIPFLTEPDHGTACLGIIGARDDGKGVVGVAPDSQLYFFPATSVEEGGRLFSAMASAFQTFEAGDILSYSIGPAGVCGTLASGTTARNLLRVGTDLGIINVLAAGNFCCNLAEDDPFADDALEAGCVTVGAVTPGRPYNRLGFSNHTNVGDDHIDVAAWGTIIATAGYGDLFFTGSPLRTYTSSFGGTSGACPMVAGGLACLQGLAKQFYGVPLNADQMKSVITFIPQGELLDPDDLPGSPPNAACFGDFDPDAEPRWVVGFFDPLASTEPMLATLPLFDGSPLIDDFFIRRGTLEGGNLFSLKSIDNNFLTIRAVRVEPGTSGLGPGLAPTPPGPVLGFGLVTDIDVMGHSDQKVVDELSLITRTRSTTSFLGIMFIEMYNWDISKYQFIDFTFIDNADPIPILEFPVPVPSRFINEADGAFVIRLWTVVPGNPAQTVHKIQHDFVGVQVNPKGGKG